MIISFNSNCITRCGTECQGRLRSLRFVLWLKGRERRHCTIYSIISFPQSAIVLNLQFLSLGKLHSD